MKQSNWDVEEMVALVDIFFKNRNAKPNEIEDVLMELSQTLNKRADILKIPHDSIFRNLNGMKMNFSNLMYLDTDGKYGMSNISKMAYYVYYMYKVDRERFDEILLDFNKKYR